MTYGFPDVDTLRLALTSAVVPPAVSLAPVAATFDTEGNVWLRPAAKLAREAETGLRRLGVRCVKEAPAGAAESLSCWLQALPLHGHADATRSPQAPVLFELPDAGQLADLVGEVLRLGNDRQAFRWLEDGADVRALLRVVGPPYYSLLRATDGGPGTASTPLRAYVERAPQVWVEIGYTHPLVEQVRPPEGKLLLMRPPRDWALVGDAPFRDIYEILDFTLPAAPAAWRPAELERRLTVSLRLVRGGPPEPAELWVLHQRPVEQLDALVQNADDHLLARLAFAVGERAGRRTIVLRARPSRGPLPVLVLEAEGFRPFLKLPNLFVPCGARLHPPLRRDAVRGLLAADPAVVTWLFPNADGTFVPERLPEDAFRPLSDWVDYVLDHEHRALQAWVESCRFEFEPFVCRDEQEARPRTPPAAEKISADEPGRLPAEQEAPAGPQAKPAQRPRPRREAVPEAVEPDELLQRLRGLEQRFLELQAPLDAAERQPLWRALAEVHGALDNRADAGVCWLHALWDVDASSGALRPWLRAETRDRPADALTSAAVDSLVVEEEPSFGDVRLLAAASAGGAHGDAREVLGRRLGPVQRFLERHERTLPVRAAWLAWLGLAALAGGDVLALARARDRLLERLYRHGLSADLDLPAFLRFAGQAEGSRLHSVRDCLVRLRGQARAWIRATSLKGVHADPQLTAAYADLIFAFGLARLGEVTASEQAVAQAKEVLVNRDDVHDFLLEAFDYRIRQARGGADRTGPLPAEQIEYLEHMAKEPRYVVDQLRANLRILEPHEKLDPYRLWKSWRNDDLGRELALLPDVGDPQAVAERLNHLWHRATGKKQAVEARARVLTAALELAPRVGEAFGLELLGRVAPLVAELPGLEERAALLEKGLFLAGHFGQAEHVARLVGLFHELLDRFLQSKAVQKLDTVVAQCFRGLRKLGMRDEIDRLLGHIAHVVTRGAGPAAVAPSHGAGPEALRTLLHVATGWYYFGATDRAAPVLEQARQVLFEGDLPPREQKLLAQAYAAALGQAPVGFALPRVEGLFHGLERIQDAFTTNTHYGLSKLVLVEAVVLALVSDDFTVSGELRRWLDEDEYLVRRRIHRDVRGALARAGLQEAAEQG
jgi:hypothetical protein